MNWPFKKLNYNAEINYQCALVPLRLVCRVAEFYSIFYDLILQHIRPRGSVSNIAGELNFQPLARVIKCILLKKGKGFFVPFPLQNKD